MDSYCVKLQGKAEIPEPLKIGHNLRTTIEGSITSETIEDNEDGSFTHVYKFAPVLVELIKETGETIKAKDVRSRGQQLRGVLWRRWKNLNEPISFEEYYDQEMTRIISQEIRD